MENLRNVAAGLPKGMQANLRRIKKTRDGTVLMRLGKMRIGLKTLNEPLPIEDFGEALDEPELDGMIRKHREVLAIYSETVHKFSGTEHGATTFFLLSHRLGDIGNPLAFHWSMTGHWGIWDESKNNIESSLL